MNSIKAIRKILEVQGEKDLAELLKHAKGKLTESGSYGTYTNSFLSTFEIHGPPERIAILAALSKEKKDIIEKAIYLVYPLQDESPEINNIIYKVDLEDEIVIKEQPRNVVKIFYSWQSDIFSNKKGIRNSLSVAINLLNKDYPDVKFEVDSDVRGTPGSQDIPTTLFGKIENSDIFLADVSLVGENSLRDSEKPKKYIPNPNVMIELGYAAGTLGWNRTLMVMNTLINSIEELPFDINKRVVIGYKYQVQKGAAKILGKRIYFSLKTIVDEIMKEKSKNDIPYHILERLHPQAFPFKNKDIGLPF